MVYSIVPVLLVLVLSSLFIRKKYRKSSVQKTSEFYPFVHITS